MMLTVGQFLSRKELTDVCCANEDWTELSTIHPKQFTQRRILHCLGIFKVSLTDEIYSHFIMFSLFKGTNIDAPSLALLSYQQWTEVERFKECCKSLEVGLLGEE